MGRPCDMIRILLALSSSLLLILCFPNFDLGFIAWVSLVPLLLALHRIGLKYSFFLSFACGVVFLMGISIWLFEVPNYTFLHHALIIFYLGLYFAFSGLMFSLTSKRCGMTLALFAAPFFWVMLEYIHSNLSFVAMPWALLAHSQYQYPLLIQIASLGGTYSISFLIVIVNSAIVAIILSAHEASKFSKDRHPKISPPFPLEKEGTGLIPALSKQHGEGFRMTMGRKTLLITTAILFGFTLLYGGLTASQSITGKRVRVSLVQGNIPQENKWDSKYAREIMQIYAQLTDEASKDRPELIIWPETATPGYADKNFSVYNEVTKIAKDTGTFLLFGNAQFPKFSKKEDRSKHTNSANLIPPDPKGMMTQQYDKIRLLPFGEYLPYKGIIPWSSIHAPNISENLPGKQFTIFKLPDFRFGVTICWENIFPDHVRQFVKRGAQLIINITNEAWFGRTAAPHQLASMSVFRAVENRVFVIRCANTGVSCIIDPQGRIVDRVKDDNGRDIFVRGVLSGWIVPLDSRTLYTQYGDWFVWLSFIGSGAALFYTLSRRHSYKKIRIKTHELILNRLTKEKSSQRNGGERR